MKKKAKGYNFGEVKKNQGLNESTGGISELQGTVSMIQRMIKGKQVRKKLSNSKPFVTSGIWGDTAKLQWIM